MPADMPATRSAISTMTPGTTAAPMSMAACAASRPVTTGSRAAGCYGLETDIALSRAEATEEEDDIGSLDLERVRLDYVGTVRGRVGFAAGRFLVFGTGGFAYGGLELYDDADSQKTTQIGWTAGGGVEFKLTDQASVKLDYLFVDLGDETLTVDDDERNIEFDAHLVRAGANYRF